MIRGRAHIAQGALVEDSYIGSLYGRWPECPGDSDEVEFSILLNETEICDLPYRLDASVIGAGRDCAGKYTTDRASIHYNWS